MKNPNQIRKNDKSPTPGAQPKASERAETAWTPEEKLAIREAAELLGLTARQFMMRARRKSSRPVRGSLVKKTEAFLSLMNARELKVYSNLVTAFCHGIEKRKGGAR